MARRFLFLLILFLGILLACSGGTPEVEPPPRFANESSADDETRESVIVAPITLSYDFLTSTIREATPSPIYTTEAQKIAASIVADITVKQNGDITALPRGDVLRITVPVRVRVDAYRQRANGSAGASLGQGRAQMNLIIDMTFSIGDDWSLIADSTIRYRWTADPTFTIAGITLDVQDLVEEQLDEQLPTIQAALEEELQKSRAIRSQVRKAWNMLRTPRTLSDDPPLTMQLRPSALSATDPEVSPSGLAVTIGISGPVSIWLGDSDPEDSSIALPDRSRSSTDNTATRVFLPLYLHWDAIVEQINEQLVGQVMTTPLPAGAGDASATITEILDVYPSGDQIAIGIRLQAQASGQTVDAVAWLLGTPTVNRHNQTFSLTDFSFAAKTDSAILNVALDALYENILDTIQDRLSFSLQKPLDALLVGANQSFSAQEVGDGIQLEASLQDLSLLGIRLTETYLIIDAKARGEMALHISQ